MNDKTGLRTETLRLTSEHSKPLLLCLEPVGEQVMLEPHSAYEIVTSGRGDGHVEIILEHDKVTVYGWNGSDSAVFHDGEFVAGMDPSRSP
jgi:hypothetical protein